METPLHRIAKHDPYLAPIAGGVVGFDPPCTGRLRHRLWELELFRDDALITLLDRHPKEHLRISTMGSAATEWRQGHAYGLSGREIFDAVRSGRLWVHVKLLDKYAGGFAELTRALFAEIAAHQGGAPPSWMSTSLFLSSPRASVPFHVDSTPNILWQVRGAKRVFVYPANDARLVPAEAIERVCSAASGEALPYRPEFDKACETVELQPGRGVMWSHHAPHRVENLEGLNLTLSTEYLTKTSRRKIDLCRGNRILRQNGLSHLVDRIGAPKAPVLLGLALGQRVLRRVRPAQDPPHEPNPSFVIDPNAPQGFVDESLED